MGSLYSNGAMYMQWYMHWYMVNFITEHLVYLAQFIVRVPLPLYRDLPGRAVAKISVRILTGHWILTEALQRHYSR